MTGAPCMVCGSNIIPRGLRRGLATFEVGHANWTERVWSAIDDYAPVHVVCERRRKDTKAQWFYFGPRRRFEKFIHRGYKIDSAPTGR